MRKKNKLYTANRWNRPMFMPDNVFADGGGINISGIDVKGNGITGLSNPTSIDMDAISSMKTPNLGLSQGISSLVKSGIGAIGGAVGSAVGKIGGNLISGGLQSGAGKAISNIGGTIGGAISMGNPVLGGIVSAGTGIIGGFTNRVFGSKLNEEKIAEIEGSNKALNTTQVDNSSIESIENQWANQDFGADFSKSDIGKDGWVSNKAGNKYKELKKQQDIARNRAFASYENAIDAADTQADLGIMANYAAFGGPLDSVFGNQGGGAIDYGFMSDYLTTKNKAAGVKDKISTNVFGNLPVTPLSTFALGGDMQTNGGDFSDGLQVISAGGSHEQSPYGGVQVGISRENGSPNLVEEGETIFDDYVFSKRLKADAKTKKKFHVGKNSDISYADLSKKLEKESLERPNDPISQAGLTKQLHSLADEQERQKGEEQQREAQEAFEQLPPEQQQAIMQQIAMEEQQAQQANEQPVEQQEVNPQQVEQHNIDEQMMQQQAEQQPMEEPQLNACGGKINRFDNGGDTSNKVNYKQKFYNLLSPYVENGIHTDSDFDKWLIAQKLDRITDWDNILKNKPFMDAVAAQNPVLADAISKGYDFGSYKAPTGKYDFEAFKKKVDGYNKSKIKGNLAGNYAIDKDFNTGKYKNIKELEESPNYKAYTQYGSDVLRRTKGIAFKYKNRNETYDNIDWKDPNKTFTRDDWEALQAIQHQIDGTSINPNGDVVPLWNKVDNNGYSSIANNASSLFNTYRTDGKGGVFHFTPDEVIKNNKVVNLVKNANGNIEPIIGDVPKEWNSIGTYSWSDANGGNTYNYYERPTDAIVIPNENKQEKIIPAHKPTWGRYAGLFGPAVGLGMQALGIGKPDYSKMDAAVEAASGAPALASYKPIGNYIGYRPMDIWYEQNRMNANARATDRAILNNASPVGTKTAGLLANGYNEQLGMGNLYRQALEYNDAQRQKVADFNRQTDLFNAQAFNQTSATNAQLQNNHKNFKAQMMMDAARQRMASDAAWNQGIYGNVSGLFRGLSDWGKENAQHNMIADMAADGIFGVMTPNSNTGRRVVTAKKSRGGRINRKRGLTF